MTHIKKLFALTAISTLLTACGGLKPFTTEQQAKLTPIAVMKSATPDKAFYDVSIKSFQMPRYTTGLVDKGGFISMAIDISDAVQQGKFSTRYGVLLNELKKKSQEDLDTVVAAQLKRDLESIPFFAGKIKDSAATKIELVISDNGFVRAGSDKGATSAVDNLPLAYGASASVIIKDGSGGTLYSAWVNAQSKTTGDVPTLVANDFEMVKTMQLEVATMLSNKAKLAIETKLAAK